MRRLTDGELAQVLNRAPDIEPDTHEISTAELRVLVTEIQERRANERINEEIFSEGFWQPCSGCHESNEGHSTGPYSEVFRCHLGGGCFECGGIGVVWEQFDADHHPAGEPAT